MGAYPTAVNCTVVNKLYSRPQTYFKRKRAKQSKARRKLPVGAYQTAINCMVIDELYSRPQTYFKRKRAKRSGARREPPAGAYPPKFSNTSSPCTTDTLPFDASISFSRKGSAKAFFTRSETVTSAPKSVSSIFTSKSGRR